MNMGLSAKEQTHIDETNSPMTEFKESQIITLDIKLTK
jgi:hypothetical protein